jgi:ABC-type uncharacterized transport system substrate-binding protein
VLRRVLSWSLVRDHRLGERLRSVAKILSGANPAELAMSPPQQVELVLNLQAAASIGYVFPPSILERATEVIR